MIRRHGRLQLVRAGTSDALVLNGISKRAFDSDVEVGASSVGGPPGYMSIGFHTKMAKGKHLYKLVEGGLIVGGAILFPDGDKMNIARIFVAPEHFKKGFGVFIMMEIEEMFQEVKTFVLDTPLWNVRTNQFYQKLGYVEYKRDSEFAYYIKTVTSK